MPFDQLPEPDAVRSQAQFLQRWGIDELVAEGVRVWTEQAARPGLEAMRMRSRVAESEALLDPTGLGAFLVAEWRRPDAIATERHATVDADRVAHRNGAPPPVGTSRGVELPSPHG